MGVESSGSLPQPSVMRGDREREGNKPGANGEALESAPLGTTVSASAKLFLRGVSSGPLRYDVGGICLILENYEVRSPPRMLSATLTCPAAYEGEHISRPFLLRG